MIFSFLLIGPHNPEAVQKLRAMSRAPIIAMGKDDLIQIATMLLAGADRYIPYGMSKELEAAHIKAVFRRC